MNNRPCLDPPPRSDQPTLVPPLTPAQPEPVVPDVELEDLLAGLGNLPGLEQAAVLRADQVERWQRGERLRAEAYLERLPALRADSEAVVDLIYNEVVLREAVGERPQLPEYLERFPDQATALQRQFALHEALRSQTGSNAGSELARTGPPLITPNAPTWSGVRMGPTAGSVPRPNDSAHVDVPGYEILGVLGRGGMGIVYKARQTGLKRLVALKMLLDSAQAGPSDLARFRTEAEALGRLQHPNIVQVYDVGEHTGKPYFSLEFCAGGSLDRKLARTPLPGRDAAQVVETLARAISAAHRQQVIHRDLKPANVLLAEDGTLKLTDFGLAKKLDDVGQTHAGSIMGTPSYMAPEQARGDTQAIGPAADIYALGAILYECLTGRPPFRAAKLMETLRLVTDAEPVPPSRLNPSCPRDLETICLKCLQKGIAQRYASAELLADDLRRWLTGEPILARPVGALERAWKWARRRPALATLYVFSAVLLVGLTAGWVLWQRFTLQAELAEARESARQARQREDCQGQLRSAQNASSAGDAAGAREHIKGALALSANEPALADLHQVASRLLDEIERREQADRNLAGLFRGRDEALFLLNRQLLTGGTQAESLQQARERAAAAMAPFATALEGEGPPRFDPLYRAAEQEQIRLGCFELLLIEAEAVRREAAGGTASRELQLLDAAERLLPGSRIVHLRKARTLRQAGEAERARPETAKAAAKPAGALDAFLEGCDAWLEEKDPAEAVRLFDTAVRLRTDLFWAHFFRALACQQLQQPAEARAALAICINERPDFIWSYLLRGFFSTELGASRSARGERESAFQAAEADFARAAELEQQHPDETARYLLLVYRGVLQMRRGDLPGAIDSLQKAIALRPEQYHAHANLAYAYRAAGKPDLALKQLDEAVRRKPDEASLYRRRAHLHLSQKDLDAAIQDLDAVIRLEEQRGAEPDARRPVTLAEDHLERAIVLYRRAQYQDAVKACEDALRAYPGLVIAYRLEGMAQMKLRRYPEALAAFDVYEEKKGPPAVDVFRTRAQAHLHLGHEARSAEAARHFGDAVADFGRAIALKPNDAELLAARGWAYLASEAPRLALPDFDEALELRPNNPDARNGRGFTLAQLGRYRDGVADAEKALRIGTRDQRTLHYAARIYALAVAKLEESPTQRGRQALELRAEWQDRALGLLRSCLEQTPVAERTAFWQQVERDHCWTAVRQSPGFRKLAAQYRSSGS